MERIGLENSIVRRGGVSTSRFSGETHQISADILEDGLRIWFTIPSKGGGDTYIEVVLGEGDLRNVVKKLALKIPNMADAFSEAAHIAVVSLIATKSDALVTGP